MSLYINESHLKKKVQFSSLNSFDNVLWSGRITALADYTLVKTIYGSAIDIFNEQVRRSTNNTSLVASELHYFIINNEEQDNPILRPFANEWIVPGTLSVIEEKVAYYLMVYTTPDEEKENVLTALKASGYDAVFVEKGSLI